METALGFIKVGKMNSCKSAETISSRTTFSKPRHENCQIPVRRTPKDTSTLRSSGSMICTSKTPERSVQDPSPGRSRRDEGDAAPHIKVQDEEGHEELAPLVPKELRRRSYRRKSAKPLRSRQKVRSDTTLTAYGISDSFRSSSWTSSRSASSCIPETGDRSLSSLICDIETGKDLVDAITTTYEGCGLLDASKFLHWDAMDFLTDGEVVGTGSQGIIYTATWNGKKVAVKIGPDVSILQEHITVSQFDHPCIVKTYGWSSTKESELQKIGVSLDGEGGDGGEVDDSPVFCAVYEYCGKRDLKNFLRSKPKYRRDIKFMSAVLVDILDGLKAIHQAGYLHCDIKPDNILIDDDLRAKIADFGLCQKMKPGMCVQGTPSYIAPEMVSDWFGCVENCMWDSKADIFSFGVLVAVCVTGAFPFARITEKLKARRGLRDHKHLLRHFAPSPHLMAQIAQLCHPLVFVIHKCLKFCPDQRADVDEVRDVVEDLRQQFAVLDN